MNATLSLYNVIDSLVFTAIHTAIELRILEIKGESRPRLGYPSSFFQLFNCYQLIVDFCLSFLTETEPEPEHKPESEPEPKQTNEKLHLTSIKVSELKTALTLLSQSVDSIDFKDTITINCENGILSLYASNIQTTNQYKLGKIESNNFSYRINFSKFKKAIAKIDKNQYLDIYLKTVTFDSWLDQELILAHKNSQFCLQCLDATDYYPLPSNDVFSVMTVDKTFLNDIKVISKSVSSCPTKHVLTGIHFVTSDNRLILEASDGHKLVQKHSIKQTTGINVIIPPCLFPTVSQIKDTFTLSIGYERAFIKLGNLIRSAKLIDGKFPDLDLLDRSGNAVTLIVDRLELRNQMEIAKAYIAEYGVKGSCGVKISCNPDSQSLEFYWQGKGLELASAIASTQKFKAASWIVIDPDLILPELRESNSEMVAVTLGCFFSESLPCIGLDSGVVTWIMGLEKTVYHVEPSPGSIAA